MIEAATETKGTPSLKTGTRLPDSLAAFAPSAYRGDSPPRQDLIEGRLPRGKLVILAGEGDVGKSWMLLDLFCAINDGGVDHAFGGKVVRGGLPCIFLSGEDDRATVDWRLKTIRQSSSITPADHGAIVPAPDIGVMNLVGRDYNNTIKATDVLDWLDVQLQAQRDAFGDLGFLVIDTLSTFLPVNANAPEEVQGAYAALNVLAAKHDLCVIVTHHVAKGSDHKTRAAIRGSTAVVDGARAAYVLHRLDEEEVKRVRTAHNCLDGEMIRLQIVKNNLGLDRTPATFMRRSDGSLADISALVQSVLGAPGQSPEQALVQVVMEAFNAGRPLTSTGESGVYKRRDSTWPGGIGTWAKGKLENLAGSAVDKGLIVKGAKGVLMPPP